MRKMRPTSCWYGQGGLTVRIALVPDPSPQGGVGRVIDQLRKWLIRSGAEVVGWKEAQLLHVHGVFGTTQDRVKGMLGDVYTSHGVPWTPDTEEVRKRIRQHVLWSLRLTAVSNYTKGTLQSFLGVRRIETILNGWDEEEIAAADPAVGREYARRMKAGDRYLVWGKTSFDGPNAKAFDRLKVLAEAMPDVKFVSFAKRPKQAPGCPG